MIQHPAAREIASCPGRRSQRVVAAHFVGESARLAEIALRELLLWLLHAGVLLRHLAYVTHLISSSMPHARLPHTAKWLLQPVVIVILLGCLPAVHSSRTCALLVQICGELLLGTSELGRVSVEPLHLSLKDVCLATGTTKLLHGLLRIALGLLETVLGH